MEPWSDVVEAIHWRHACPQTGFDHPPYEDKTAQTQTMSEDCLFLSVWRPEKESKVPRSVMVFFHGGSFEHGNVVCELFPEFYKKFLFQGTIFTKMYDGRYLASRDVIVVTVNYRLGLFGYLYSGTSEALGNQGLQDQLLALKWVHANIHSFGGNPNDVTIFGESAGAFSIVAFTLSPLTKGLFHRAILQSGAATAVTTNEQNQPLKRTEAVAKMVNCPTESMKETLKCLRGKTMEELLKAQAFLKSFGLVPTAIFEDEICPFKNAVPILESGNFNKDIDFMYGVTGDEGSIFLATLMPDLRAEDTSLTVNQTKELITKLYINDKFGHEIVDFYMKKLPTNPSQDQLK